MGEDGVTETYTVQVSQNGCTLDVYVPIIGMTFKGALNQNKLGWSGSYASELFLKNLNGFEGLKRASLPFAGVEKCGVHSILQGNPNVVDVEIALSIEADEDQKASAQRIDFASLQESRKGV